VAPQDPDQRRGPIESTGSEGSGGGRMALSPAVLADYLISFEECS